MHLQGQPETSTNLEASRICHSRKRDGIEVSCGRKPCLKCTRDSILCHLFKIRDDFSESRECLFEFSFLFSNTHGGNNSVLDAEVKFQRTSE